MGRRNLTEWIPACIGIVALVAAGWMLGHGDALAQRASSRASVKGQLHPTTVDPGAEGQFEENVEDGLPDGSGEPQGDLAVTARKLAPKTTLGVNVGGARIGTLRTNRAGKGRAKFSSQPRGRTQPLTVDPRGKQITLTNGTEDTVLEGNVSDPTTPGGIQCCLSIHDASGDQEGCDVLLAADCTAAGGTAMGAGTCEPDPCPNSGPDGETSGGTDTGGDGATGN